MKWLALAIVLVALLVSREAAAGYTHYWKWLREPDPAKLEPAVAEMKRLADAKRDILDVPDAGGGLRIGINGIGDEAHEPFVFPGGGRDGFNFVKTAYKPYDVVVTACLIVARDHFGLDELEISSDGDWAESWRPGAELYTKVLGRAAKNPLSHEAAGTLPDEPPVADPEEPPKSSRLRAIAITVAVLLVLVILRLIARGGSR